MAEYWPTADTDAESDDQHVECSRKGSTCNLVQVRTFAPVVELQYQRLRHPRCDGDAELIRMGE